MASRRRRPGEDGLVVAWARFVVRRRRWVLGAWAVLVASMVGFSLTASQNLSPVVFDFHTEAGQVIERLQHDFPQRRLPALVAVFQSDRGAVSDPGFQRQLSSWTADLRRLAGQSGGDAVVTGPITAPSGRAAAIVVSSSRTADHLRGLAADARNVHHDGPAAVYLGGLAEVYESFIVDSQAGLQNSERFSLPVALVLLLLVFGGLVAASLPVLTGLATVTVAIAIIGFVAHVHQVSVFALNVTTVLGLGLGIDYSLLVVNRFREEVRAGRSPEEAVVVTVRSAGTATALSGGAVLIGCGALLLSPINELSSMGLGAATVAALSVVASMSLIPALLAASARRIDRLALPFVRQDRHWFAWAGLARVLLRRPVAFIAAGLLIVGLIAFPATRINLGVVGIEHLPGNDPAVVAEDIARQQFGVQPTLPVFVLAHGVDDVAAASAVEARIRTVTGGQPVVGAGDVAASERALYLRPPYAVYDVTQPGGDNDPQTRQMLDRLRDAQWPPGISVQIGGEAAAYQDFLRVIEHALPIIAGAVIGLTLLLLGIAFRSVMLPLKAVLMNLFSVAAAIGVLTWVFQDGHLASLLDVRGLGFIDAAIPPVIFAALFGLSMDYEVFLLSRIREEYVRTRDNAAAVALGLERTGRIITSAALIMVVVFASLTLSSLSINKAFGLTFAVAVLLDATLIRLVLVPTIMQVMGRVNWWPGVRTQPTLP